MSIVYCLRRLKNILENAQKRYKLLAYLITRTKSVHRADLVGRESLPEEVNSCHLSAEDAFLIQLGCGANVALVERLGTNQTLKFNLFNIFQTF